MSAPDALAKAMYRCGRDVHTIAEVRIRTLLEVYGQARESRHDDPAAFPILGDVIGDGVLARRIIATLLDAGWDPPNMEGTS